MIKIFGKKLCSACQKKKAELEADGIMYSYFDLDTPEGLAEAAYQGLLRGKLSLPIILEEDLQGDPIHDSNSGSKKSK